MSPRVATAVRWAFAIGVVGVLLSFVDLEAIRIRLAATDLRLALPALIGLVLVHVIAVGAWRRLLRELACVSLDWVTSLRLYYAAQVLGTITPANLGADAYRVLAVGDGTSRALLVRPVLIQRLTSVAALVLLGVAGAVSLPIAGLGPYIAGIGVLGAVVLAISVAAAHPAAIAGWGGRVARRLGWASGDASNTDGLRSAIRDGLGLGLLFHATSLGLGLVLVVSVDPQLETRPWLVLAALAVARLSLAVPLSPNGIGIQEGLLALLFVQVGLPADVAIAAGLLNRLGFLATAGVGVACLLARPRTRRSADPHPIRSAARVQRSSIRQGGA